MYLNVIPASGTIDVMGLTVTLDVFKCYIESEFLGGKVINSNIRCI